MNIKNFNYNFVFSLKCFTYKIQKKKKRINSFANFDDFKRITLKHFCFRNYRECGGENDCFNYRNELRNSNIHL